MLINKELLDSFRADDKSNNLSIFANKLPEIGRFDNLTIADRIHSGFEEESALYSAGSYIHDKYSHMNDVVDESYDDDMKLADLEQSGLDKEYYEYAMKWSNNKNIMNKNIKELKEQQLRHEYKKQAFLGGLGYDLLAGVSDFIVPVGVIGQAGKYSLKIAQSLKKFSTVANITRSRRLVTGLAVDGTIEATKYFLNARERTKLDLALSISIGAGANVLFGKPAFEVIAQVGRESIINDSKMAMRANIIAQTGKDVKPKEIDELIAATIKGDSKKIDEFVSKYEIDEAIDLDIPFQTQLKLHMNDMEEDLFGYDNLVSSKMGKFHGTIKATHERIRYDMQHMMDSSPSSTISGLSKTLFSEGTLETSTIRNNIPLANVRMNMEGGLNNSLNLAIQEGRLMFTKEMGGAVFKTLNKMNKNFGGVMSSFSSNSEIYDMFVGKMWHRMSHKRNGYINDTESIESISKELIEIKMSADKANEIAKNIVDSLKKKNDYSKQTRLLNGDLATLNNTIPDNPYYTPSIWTSYSKESLLNKGLKEEDINNYLFHSFISGRGKSVEEHFARGTTDGDKLYQAITNWYKGISKTSEVARTNADRFEDMIKALIDRDGENKLEGSIKMLFNGKIPSKLEVSKEVTKDVSVHRRTIMDFDRSLVRKYGDNEIEFADFMEHNVRSTHASMARKYSGRSALEQVKVKVGDNEFYLDTNEKILDFFTQAKKELNDNTELSATKKHNELIRLEHTLKDLMGIPTNTGNMQHHLLSNTLNNFTYARTLGLSAFKMVSEMNAVAWKQGLEQAIKSIPQAKKIFGLLQSGKIDDDLVEELAIYTGQAKELIQGSSSTKYDHAFNPLNNYGSHKISGIMGDAQIAKVHSISEKFRDAVMFLNGMKPIDAMLRIGNDVAFVNNIIDFGYKSRAGTLTRDNELYLKQAGITKDDLESFLKEAETHSEIKGTVDYLDKIHKTDNPFSKPRTADIKPELDNFAKTMLRKEEYDLLSGSTSLEDYGKKLGLSKNETVQMRAEINDLTRKLGTLESMAKEFGSDIKIKELMDYVDDMKSSGMSKQSVDLERKIGKLLGITSDKDIEIFADSIDIFMDSLKKSDGSISPIKTLKSINVLMHEVVHSGFDKLYHTRPHFKETLDSLFQDVTQGLNHKNILIGNMKMQSKEVGLQSPIDFLSEVISNRKFANQINKVKLSNRTLTLLDSFKDIEAPDSLINQMINTSLAKSTKKGDAILALSKTLKIGSATKITRTVRDISKKSGIKKLNIENWDKTIAKKFFERQNRLGNTLIQRSNSVGDEAGIVLGEDLIQNRPFTKLIYTLKSYAMSSNTKQLGRSINENDMRMFSTQLSQLLVLMASLTTRNLVTAGSDKEEFKMKQKHILNESIASLNFGSIWGDMAGLGYVGATGENFSYGRHTTTTDYLTGQIAPLSTVNAYSKILEIPYKLFQGETGKIERDMFNLLPELPITGLFHDKGDLKSKIAKQSKEKAKRTRLNKKLYKNDEPNNVDKFNEDIVGLLYD